MAWVTWRLHRPQVLAAAGLVAAVAVLALATSLPVRDAYHRQALSSCLPPAAQPDCDLIVSHFRAEFATRADAARYLVLLPALALLVGAPGIAREFEHGTFRLAWTQGVTRRRWLLSRTLLLAAGVVVGAAALAAIGSWWRVPFDHVDGRIAPGGVDVQGPVVPAYALFALALGVLAAVALRRTLAAISLAAALFVATRVGVEKLLRPHYLPPLHRNTAGVADAAHARDWILDNAIVDAAGRRITSAREDLAVVHAQHAGIDAQQYLASLGWRRVITFQPDGRFWTFQLIEAGIFVALAAAAIVAAVSLVRRRAA
jgi:hypothetical protein